MTLNTLRKQEVSQIIFKSTAGDDLMKLVKIMPTVCNAVSKVNTDFQESKINIWVFYHTIPRVLFHGFDISAIVLQCRKWFKYRKTFERVRVPKRFTGGVCGEFIFFPIF